MRGLKIFPANKRKVRRNILYSLYLLTTRSVEQVMQASYSTPSPQSASMCVRQEEEDEEGKHVSPDSKEYYDQLIVSQTLVNAL